MSCHVTLFRCVPLSDVKEQRRRCDETPNNARWSMSSQDLLGDLLTLLRHTGRHGSRNASSSRLAKGTGMRCDFNKKVNDAVAQLIAFELNDKRCCIHFAERTYCDGLPKIF